MQAAVVMLTGAATGFGVCAGCSAASERVAERRAAAQPSAELAASAVSRAPVAAPVIVVAAGASAASAKPSSPTPKTVASALRVKRLVVTTAVRDREPVSVDALVSDGSAIYAFAELANEGGESGSVRVTFERKGGAERVGDVSLPVPANAARYRTWAFTRFIRDPGVWDAVVWSESGVELGRTSFEVG